LCAAIDRRNNRKITLDKIEKIFENTDVKIVPETYDGSTKKAEFRCLKNIEHPNWWATPTDLMRSFRCPKCSKRESKGERELLDYVASLNNEKAIAGAAYVLTGAHLMGGEIMRRRLEGFPTLHLEWDDRKESIAVLQSYRTRDDITEEARGCFQALLNVMDEIESLYTI
jgi:hypothetical protein